MQLVKMSSTFIPITIAASSFLTPKSIISSGFDAYSNALSIMNSQHTAEYLNAVDKSDTAIYPQQFKVEDYIKFFKEQALILSSPEMVVKNKYFQALVVLGKDAVPYIISDLEKEPSILVWTLNIIYNKKISNNSNITLVEASKLWVAELKNQKGF
ncbi:MAG: hypothetical protein E7108_08695 [Bacteroidales bacterium]|jgi:hypothetical protein|nr:hypothetical protein [Bacteroidales bacterium]